MAKEIVFVSGKYRGDIEANITKAESVAKRLWQEGFIVICPHLNTARFDGICSDDIWLLGYLEILKRCDSIYMMDNWQESEGSYQELKVAREAGLKIYWE